MAPHRSGIATVTVEVEAARPGTLLLRIRTEDDTQRETPAADRLGEPFHDVDAAMAYLRAWLDRWIASA